MTDTPQFRVDGVTLERLKTVMSLSRAANAVGFALEKNKMIFFKYLCDAATPFPSPLPMDRCAELAFDWLHSDGCDHGQPMDHDGHSDKGWMVYCDDWGQIEGYDYHSFMAVMPYWQHFGK